ncbi:histone PARylation factor 1-like isoform X5 [Daktulosphaira vitifoliae]|uniref:histone PARylation factor 1-like isoform X5 n=1 Tax=Daktulosphaira vitifoliae TaxID=58002 RepID=UPI0021A9A0F4|nr:histone PARylation factor 1-like isoform X5 [Daktulosphaira vitifoliae]
MEKFFEYQKDSREPCKYGRKCFQTNKEHLNKYKHPPIKDDVKVQSKKTSKKRDSSGNVKLNKKNGESSSINENDMEVPEQSNLISSNTTSTSTSDNMQNELNEHNPINAYAVRYRSQQQLLLTNTNLEECSGVDDGIVPSTPTLYTPRRLDGETVSSPHVPSSNQVQRFTFHGTSQNSQATDSNDSEQSVTSERIMIPGMVFNPAYWNKQISKLFLVGDMPEEFYDLWSFCKRQNSTHPEDAFLSVGLKLVGPYDVLAGHFNEFNSNNNENAVLHWRYYYDPPEFQTIITSVNSSQYHIGYFRDEPLAMPVFVASNDAEKNCVIQNLGHSLFQALRKYLHNMEGQVAYALQKKLHAFEKRKVKKYLKGRQGTAVAKTFHKAGIYVPYDRKTDIGYRPLSESDSVLRKILKSYREASKSKKVAEMDKLQPIITYANIANDECDFGTGLELGIDIFCDGNSELHRICKQLLVTVYNLLRRPQFATIIQAHLDNRRKNSNLSIL